MQQTLVNIAANSILIRICTSWGSKLGSSTYMTLLRIRSGVPGCMHVPWVLVNYIARARGTWREIRSSKRPEIRRILWHTAQNGQNTG